MSNKEVIIEPIRKLPEELGLEEIAVLAAIRKAEEDAHAVRTIPHEEVRRRFQGWISK